jgi:hypothetical protein
LTQRLRTARWALATALLLISASRLTLAQETREHEFPDLDRELELRDLVGLRLTLANRFVANADFGTFEANSYQPEGRLRITVPVAKNAGLRLLCTGRVLIYDFNRAPDLFGTGDGDEDPFGDLDSWSLKLQGAYVFDEEWTLFSDRERWSLLFEGGPKARWEGGSDISDGLTGGGSLAVGYRLGDRLELALGLSVSTKMLKDGIGVGPLFEVDWRINDDWALSSQGLGFRLERILTERFLLFLRGRIEGDRYRLNDRGGTIGKGSISIRQLPVALGFRWDLTRHLRLTVAAGALVYHKLKVKNQDDDEIGSEKADASAYVSIRFDLRR